MVAFLSRPLIDINFIHLLDLESNQITRLPKLFIDHLYQLAQLPPMATLVGIARNPLLALW